jgi:hypothetical protein
LSLGLNVPSLALLIYAPSTKLVDPVNWIWHLLTVRLDVSDFPQNDSKTNRAGLRV